MELDVIYAMVSLLVRLVLLVMKITQVLATNVMQELFLPMPVIAVLLALEIHILQLERLAVQVNRIIFQENIHPEFRLR